MSETAAEGEGRPLHRGAEATLRKVEWLGLAAVAKDREAKGYRPKALDERLRRERTRTEAKLLLEARRVGVRTPILYDADLLHHRLILEELNGPTLKQLLEDAGQPRASLLAALRALGRALGTLHANGLSHGDLTSSNVLFPDGPLAPPALLDPSMGSTQAGVEEMGIDLHLVTEDLRALDAHSESLVRSFHAGYAEGNPAGARSVRARAKEIRGRMRYV